MIKINLLPFRIARKKENIRRQISIFFLLILFTSVLMYWYAQFLDKQIFTVKQKTEQVNQQISKYKEKADRVAQIKKDLKALDEKLEIVSSLEKQKEKHFVLFKVCRILLSLKECGLRVLKQTLPALPSRELPLITRPLRNSCKSLRSQCCSVKLT